MKRMHEMVGRSASPVEVTSPGRRRLYSGKRSLLRPCWLLIGLLVLLFGDGRITTMTTFALSAAATTPKKVAVIGATGRLGREIVQQLSKEGIPTKCLLRHKVAASSSPSTLDSSSTGPQVASYLSTLPGVEMVQGGINNADSLQQLLEGTTHCVAAHGPSAPKPFLKALLFPSLWYPEDTTPSHPKQLNYEGIKKLIAAIEASPTCTRLVRVTGKGEDPWSFFSILINALGGLAKGWNYEGEQLLRKSKVDYTIIRPGIMKETLSDKEASSEYGLKDNGQDMKVTAVSYRQIADLMVQSLDYSNCARSTLTAMNVPKEEQSDSTSGGDSCAASSYAPLLQQVKPDSRAFPDSLIQEHRKAARVGGLILLGFMGLGLRIAVGILSSGLSLVFGFRIAEGLVSAGLSLLLPIVFFS